MTLNTTHTRKWDQLIEIVDSYLKGKTRLDFTQSAIEAVSDDLQIIDEEINNFLMKFLEEIETVTAVDSHFGIYSPEKYKPLFIDFYNGLLNYKPRVEQVKERNIYDRPEELDYKVKE